MSSAYGSNVPGSLFETVDVTVEGKKNEQIGIRVNNNLVVVKVERDSPSHGHLRFGDVILAVNGQKIDRKLFIDVVKKLTLNVYKMVVKITRPIIQQEMPLSRLPREYDPLPGYKYHVGVMFMITGCKLALPVKSYNNKVYVTRLTEDTLSALTLNIGDAVLDVDNQPVTSVHEASEGLIKQMKAKGFATMVIEQAVDPAAKAYVRAALLAEKTQDLDLPLAPDVVEITKKESVRFKGNPDLKPSKIIGKEEDAQLRQEFHEEEGGFFAHQRPRQRRGVSDCMRRESQSPCARPRPTN
uniref:PDZ domain-containing protein n=1 Tax=Steinernema glaseri TaxID=37863 RepID=A0A1I8A5I3_9BILA